MEEKNILSNSRYIMFWMLTGILFFLTVNNIFGTAESIAFILFSFLKLPYFFNYIIKVIFALFKLSFWCFAVFFGIKEININNNLIKGSFITIMVIFPFSYIINYSISTLSYIIPSYLGNFNSEMNGSGGSFMSYTVISNFMNIAANFLLYLILITGAIMLFNRLNKTESGK